MFLSTFLKDRSEPAHRRARSAWRLRMPLLYGAFAFLLSTSCCAAGSTPRFSNEGFPGGFAVGLVLAILAVVFSRTRIKSTDRELARLKELANHREYERNVAQQELVRRLEEERELAKEKMQFESQLSDYEKYASLAQLALGAAHEINNPLLGILSHLELEWRDANDERREEIEQCIEGAKRISSAVRGLLDYARPGPLTLSKVNLWRLADETLKFVGASADVPPDRVAQLRSARFAQHQCRLQSALADPDEPAAERSPGDGARWKHHHPRRPSEVRRRD